MLKLGLFFSTNSYAAFSAKVLDAQLKDRGVSSCLLEVVSKQIEEMKLAWNELGGVWD
jgi:hypothetical protein